MFIVYMDTETTEQIMDLLEEAIDSIIIYSDVCINLKHKLTNDKIQHLSLTHK